MKGQITSLRNERKDPQRAASIATQISEQLKSDQILLEPYLETVLQFTLPSFGKLFPVDTRHDAIDFWLLKPEFSCLSAIISSLKVQKSQKNAVKYIKKWAKNKIFAEIIESSSKSQNPELYPEITSIVFSIPERVAPVYVDTPEEKSFPPSLKKEPFFRSLALSIHSLDPLLLSKFAILGLADYLWEAKFTDAQIANAAIGVQPSSLSPLLLSILDSAPKETASAVMSVMFSKSERVQTILRSHFLTQRVLSDRALNLLLDFLIGQGEVISTIETCGAIWSRHRLVTQMSTAQHRQLSIAILKLLPKTTKESLQSSKAVNLIMSGVSAHIGITSPEIRKFGLQIGELITSILLPDQPVKFDELHPNEEEEKSDLQPKKPIPTAEEGDSDSSDVDIDSPFLDKKEESDDDLTPYAIHDDETTQEKGILHIRELISLFRTDENDVDRFKKFTDAISNAAQIIKKMTSLEFEQMGSDLLGILLSVDNEYNNNDFEDLRRDGLTALMITFPVSTAKLVIGELRKTRAHTLGRKIQLISAIAYAATELSELPKPETKKITLIEANTRRWGSALRKVTRASSVNRFSPVSPIYFYGLLNSTDLQKVVVEEDGLEAAQVLTTLAVIIEASGDSVIELQQMANDLLQVGMVMSTLNPPNARKALIFALSCAIRALKDYEGADAIGDYLVHQAENDPDEECRNMAIMTCNILAERHEERLQSLMGMVSKE